MKVLYTSLTNNLKCDKKINSRPYLCFSGGVCNDVVSFKANQNNESKKSLNVKTRFLNKLFNKKLCDCDFEKMEGVQKGLKSFEGLSLKQIAFALTDLHSINMISGCKRHCLHCYANSQPEIKRYSYEDLKQICDDIKELSNRTGTKVSYHHGTPYIDIGFDTDALECHLYDKNGKKYDLVDMAKLIKDSTGYAPVFDTNGWTAIDEEKQKIAEDYVKKLLKDDNYKNFYQINISINPFNPAYVRAVKSGYPLDDLYQPFKRIDGEGLEAEAKLSPEFKKVRDDYMKYIKDVTNTLVTFKPLLKTGKLNTIIRVVNNNIPQMTGYRVEDFSTTLNHICKQLYLRGCLWGDISKKELEQYKTLLSHYSDRIFTSGRMEKFYKLQNNGKLDDIDKIHDERALSNQNFEKLKNNKSIRAAKMRYLKMITPDGKTYMYDNYKIIPTDIQLKTSIKDIEKPFRIKVEDFVVTEDMIDLI